jgi:hypothetical protein
MGRGIFPVSGTTVEEWPRPSSTSSNPDLVRRLAGEIQRADPSFRSRAFVKAATTGLDDLELLDRGRHISRALAAHLPLEYPEAVEILLRSLGPGHATDELVGVGMVDVLVNGKATRLGSFEVTRARR